MQIKQFTTLLYNYYYYYNYYNYYNYYYYYYYYYYNYYYYYYYYYYNYYYFYYYDDYYYYYNYYYDYYFYYYDDYYYDLANNNKLLNEELQKHAALITKLQDENQALQKKHAKILEGNVAMNRNQSLLEAEVAFLKDQVKALWE